MKMHTLNIVPKGTVYIPFLFVGVAKGHTSVSVPVYSVYTSYNGGEEGNQQKFIHCQENSISHPRQNGK